MKKTVLAILAIFLLVAIGIPADKAVEVKKEVVQPAGKKEVSPEEKYQSLKAGAWKLRAEEKLIEASRAFAEVSDLAVKTFRPVRQGWMLNNAAYMLIEAHKKDNTVDLNPALNFLKKAILVANVDDGWLTKMGSNIGYINYHLGKKAATKKETKVVTPEVKKVKK